VLEAIMASFVAAVAIALFLAVLTGLGAVACAVRREDRRFTLLMGEAPDRLSKGARRLNGVGRRDLVPLDPRLFRSTGEFVH
jgi:hypothetical protein